LIVIYGACIGSFLNVVIYRVPEGKSLVRPPSSCPSCGHRLAWFDNVPVFAWLWLQGRCRYCKKPISAQYPIIEAVTSALFGFMYWLCYWSGWRPEFMRIGIEATWPAFLILLALVAGLLAATVIDAKSYLIPLRIPYAVILLVILTLPIAAVWMDSLTTVLPTVGPAGFGLAIGGLGGLALALSLLHLKILPRSFDEVVQDLNQTEAPDAFFYHPFPRAEVMKECLFVLMPLVGGILGYSLQRPDLDTVQALPPPISVLSAIVVGYLVGGGVVWLVRILGTLVFNKEAMGLGDVHLLAAIGAVLGANQAILVFFIAPFFGLIGAVLTRGIGRWSPGKERIIPYGPYLAGAAVVVMVIREPLRHFFGILGH
jgi:leader peptidase (prepilin peptidase)/N-methyltransferase